MHIKSFQEFVEFYNKYGKTPNQLIPPKNKLNNQQLKSAYNRYLKGIDKKIETSINENLKEAYEIVDKRDFGRCRLITRLPFDEYIDLKERAGSLIYIIDHAHVFSKGAYPYLTYVPENIVLLNRYSHSMLDTFRNPVFGNPILREEQIKWWRVIIGNERYDMLLRMLR